MTEKTFDLPSLVHKHRISDQLLKEFGYFVGNVTIQKFVFLSKTESIVIENEEVSDEQLPPDINLIYVKIEGANGFVEVKSRSKFQDFRQVADRTLNQITIQGANPVAVRGLQAKIKQTLDSERLIFRTIFYRFPLTWFWGTLVLLWFGEYRSRDIYALHLLSMHHYQQ